MKEKQAENAIARIQKNQDIPWKLFSLSDVRALKYILGETWVYLDRKAWDACSFIDLTWGDLEAIIQIGNALQKNEMNGRTAALKVAAILKLPP